MRAITWYGIAQQIQRNAVFNELEKQGQKTVEMPKRCWTFLCFSPCPIGKALRKYVYQNGSLQFSEASIYMISLRTYIQINAVQQLWSVLPQVYA